MCSSCSVLDRQHFFLHAHFGLHLHGMRQGRSMFLRPLMHHSMGVKWEPDTYDWLVINMGPQICFYWWQHQQIFHGMPVPTALGQRLWQALTPDVTCMVQPCCFSNCNVSDIPCTHVKGWIQFFRISKCRDAYSVCNSKPLQSCISLQDVSGHWWRQLCAVTTGAPVTYTNACINRLAFWTKLWPYISQSIMMRTI